MKFIYVIHGDYPLDHLRESLRCVRRFMPRATTELWSDRDHDVRVDSMVKYRGDEYPANLPGVQVSDKVRVRALLAQPLKEPVCYLDSDIYPVSTEFVQGFRLAETFGMAMPANPRSFVSCAHGTGDLDLSAERWLVGYQYWTPVNLGMIFLDPSNDHARVFLNLWGEIAKVNCPRASFLAATIFTKWHPYILAQQFCADAVYQNMLAMHVGGKYHAHMLEHYNTYHRA